MSARIGAIGRMRAKPGKEEELIALFEELSALAKSAEPGMLQHAIFRSRAEPGVITVVEVFRDQEAFDAHGKSPHFAEIGPRLIALIDGQLGGDVEAFDVIGTSA